MNIPASGHIDRGADKAMNDLLRQEFRMEVVGAGAEYVVRLYGELDLVYADDVHDALVACPGHDVVADLANLEFIDSTGLSALLVARRVLESNGRRLELRGAAGATRRAFEAVGLEDVLDD